MTTIKIALIQQKAVPNNKEANLKLAIQYIKEAHEKGADLVCGQTVMRHLLKMLLIIH
ncbi:Nitrilase 1 [Listeria monocytogenes]|nr:Nitrilase 1 [Listeria monocytogenes]